MLRARKIHSAVKLVPEMAGQNSRRAGSHEATAAKGRGGDACEDKPAGDSGLTAGEAA